MDPLALAEERRVMRKYYEGQMYWHLAAILNSDEETVPVEEVRRALEEVFGEEGDDGTNNSLCRSP